MTTETDDKVILLAPGVDPDDIEQEYQILKWLGKNPSRFILYKRANRFEAVLFDFTADFSSAEPIQWAETPVADLDTFSRISDWALSQSEAVQAMVFNFLEDPTDNGLETLLKTAGLTASPDPDKEVPFSTILLSYCKENRTVSELYELGRNVLFSKRPEATVRQTIRRLLKSGKLKENDNVYRLS